jgi:hypothetical protein
MGVSIRTQRGKLYLDIHANGKRTWESLKLTLTEDQNHNREAMRLAGIARNRREEQLFSGEWGLLDPINGKKTLYAYAIGSRQKTQRQFEKMPEET